MDWHLIVFEVIDMRSFSNLWFWIALAVLWSTASHWVLGVPFDMVTRARRFGGQAEADLDDLVRINTNRLLYIAEEAGLWLLALACFMLAVLTLLAFVYWIELAQALFLLGFPMSLVGMLSLRTAQRIRTEGATGALAQKRLSRLRIATQVIGMISIFVTSLWGMYQNLSASFLG
ncbi:component of SufBCD complex [Puniceibacterium confluentis]|uniref:component of SufBCD complex n=1 Tax=Puniceibacterium confluentis TaxID=1958944 RepID=UPI0011B5DE8B|nr:component of SufBCD complex [Puniceibacterium confluentis]